jgi:hypothetical protein
MHRTQQIVTVHNGMGMRFTHTYTVEPYDENERVPDCGTDSFILGRDAVPAKVNCGNCGLDLRSYYIAHERIRYNSYLYPESVQEKAQHV